MRKNKVRDPLTLSGAAILFALVGCAGSVHASCESTDDSTCQSTRAGTSVKAINRVAVDSQPPMAAPAGGDEPVFADGFESPTPQELVIAALQAVYLVRLSYTEYWYGFVMLPESMADLGGFDDPHPVGPAWATLDDGLIVMTFEGLLDGQTLALAPWELLGKLRWTCGYAMPPKGAVLLSGTTSAARTTIKPAYLPEPCWPP